MNQPSFTERRASHPFFTACTRSAILMQPTAHRNSYSDSLCCRSRNKLKLFDWPVYHCPSISEGKEPLSTVAIFMKACTTPYFITEAQTLAATSCIVGTLR